MDIHLSEGTIVTLSLAAVGYMISIGIWLVRMKWDVKKNALHIGELMGGFRSTVKRFGRLAKEFHVEHASLRQKVDDHIKDNKEEHDRMGDDIEKLKG